jgi:tetrahydromethanopterin S-methyltransferase subunit G
MFNRESICGNVYKSVKQGMVITVTVNDAIDLDRKFEYNGVGAIRIHDLSQELQTYAERQFTQGGVSAFNEQEVSILRSLLTNIKGDIQKELDVNNEDMRKVSKRIDELTDRLNSASKFDWQQLFTKCVIGISIGLGFGATVPETLYNLFKRLLEEFAEHRVSMISRSKTNQQITHKRD